MDPAVLREDMVDGLEHEAKAVVHSDAVSIAMREVPRHEFLDDGHRAYADTPHEHRGTRVLAPSTVARLIEALDPSEDDEVLVVGAGVGYTAAVLADVAGERSVQAVDIDRGVVRSARRNLERAGYEGVLVDHGDGAEGMPAYAPFDRILVEAASVRPPRALIQQLAGDGRMVLPLGSAPQTLTVVDGEGDTVERHGTVLFPPLLVDGEQASAIERNRTQREDRERARRSAQSRPGWERDWIDWEQGSGSRDAGDRL